MKHLWQTLTVFFCVLWVLTAIGLRPAPTAAESSSVRDERTFARPALVVKKAKCIPDTCILPPSRRFHHIAVWQ